MPFAIRNMQHKLLRSIIRGLIGALLTYFWGYINSQLLGLALSKAEDAMEGFVYIVIERENEKAMGLCETGAQSTIHLPATTA